MQDVSGADPDRARKLRVGVMLDDGDPPAWVARIVRDLQASDRAQVVLVIRRPGAPPVATGAVARALHGLYDALDARLFPIARDPFAPTAITDLGDVPVIDVAAR